MHPEGHLRGLGHEMSIFLKVCNMISICLVLSVGTQVLYRSIFLKVLTALIQRKINLEYLLASFKTITSITSKKCSEGRIRIYVWISFSVTGQSSRW
jgi:hypothetical protein